MFKTQHSLLVKVFNPKLGYFQLQSLRAKSAVEKVSFVSHDSDEYILFQYIILFSKVFGKIYRIRILKILSKLLSSNYLLVGFSNGKLFI